MHGGDLRRLPTIWSHSQILIVPRWNTIIRCVFIASHERMQDKVTGISVVDRRLHEWCTPNAGFVANWKNNSTICRISEELKFHMNDTLKLTSDWAHIIYTGSIKRPDGREKFQIAFTIYNQVLQGHRTVKALQMETMRLVSSKTPSGMHWSIRYSVRWCRGEGIVTVRRLRWNHWPWRWTLKMY